MSNITSQELIDGKANKMHLDVRDLATELRDIIEDCDYDEACVHFHAAQNFLEQCGYPVKDLSEAADVIADIANNGSPTLVVEGFEEEWGEDEWDNLGIDSAIHEGPYKSLIKDSVDFEELGKKMLEAERRTKASYGRTNLWVLHN